MNKNILIRYIDGSCSADEAVQVMEWVGESRENERYLTRLMNLWISQNLPQDEASEREMASMLAAVERAEPTRRKGFYISRTAALIAAACLLAAVVGIGWRALRREVPAAHTTALRLDNYEGYREFYTDKGVKGRVTLPDSSVVWLNSDSRLWYPERFAADRREVAISGEGYFEVTRDPARPMIVGTPGKDFHLEVLGTTFNLKSYGNDDSAVTTLYSGRVNVVSRGAGGEPKVDVLRPSESITIYGDRPGRVAALEYADQNAVWRDGVISFDSTPLSEVIKILERWHGTEFVVEDGDVPDYRITANFRHESIVQIMGLIRATSFIEYRIDGKKVFLRKR